MFYILATYHTIHSTYLLPIHCLYTTYITRLQIDRHYLCTIYICTTYILHIAPMHRLFRCTSYYIFPYTADATPFTRTHNTGGGGIPWTHCIHNHLPQGVEGYHGGRGDPDHGTYIIYVYIYIYIQRWSWTRCHTYIYIYIYIWIIHVRADTYASMHWHRKNKHAGANAKHSLPTSLAQDPKHMVSNYRLYKFIRNKTLHELKQKHSESRQCDAG
jgi:hypothetical protein